MHVFCGIDWAEDHYDMALVDEAGVVLTERRIDDNAIGYQLLLALLAEHGDDQIEPIPVAIETELTSCGGRHSRIGPVSASAAPVSPFRGYRFPPEIISHAVWLYHRFSLSHRDVEELLAERGIQVSYEAIRLWCRKFGPLLASELRRRHPRRGDKWYRDEVALTINMHRYWLWRAVDQDGTVLDILVQSRRDQHAAERFLRRVLDAEDGVQPRVIVTDKLASYVPAIRGRCHTLITVVTSD